MHTKHWNLCQWNRGIVCFEQKQVRKLDSKSSEDDVWSKIDIFHT